MIDKIKEYIGEAQAFSTQNTAELEAFRIKFLGTKGLLKDLFAEFKNVPNDQKKEFGQVINLLKTSAEDKVKSIQEALADKEEVQRNLRRFNPYGRTNNYWFSSSYFIGKKSNYRCLFKHRIQRFRRSGN